MALTPLVFIELNELNFDLVKQYITLNKLKLPNLKKVVEGFLILTSSEKKYSELEPWIQWASVHTGLSYAEHRIFRLGDIVESNHQQLFEYLERKGFAVGVVSAMNADNRMATPAYFIPDPWTQSPSDGSFWSKVLSHAIAQAVNDNAQSKLSFKTIFFILLGLVRFAKPKHYPLYLKFAISGKKFPWRKALFLDLFLHDVHMKLFEIKKPDFTTLFLNAGAHIQHHYLLNADPIKRISEIRNPDWYISDDNDPVAEVLELYDLILGEYFSLPSELIIATGISQCPYDRIKYYYRLKTHENFLKLIDIDFKEVVPRMTRDFLINFDSEESALKAQIRLSSIKISSDELPLFGEIDNRGQSLFVTLTYPCVVDDNTKIFFGVGEGLNLLPHVAFVAIKNGMHQEKGFAFFSEGASEFSLKEGSHVKNLYGSVRKYFEMNKK
jgi:hypothetical protein